MEIKIDPVAEQTVLSALRDGDVRRAAHLMVRYHGVSVFGTCRDLVQDHDLAEDLTQAVFARAFALLTGFRGELSSREWLIGIARQSAADHGSGGQRLGGESRGISDSLRRRLDVLAAAL